MWLTSVCKHDGITEEAGTRCNGFYCWHRIHSSFGVVGLLFQPHIFISWVLLQWDHFCWLQGPSKLAFIHVVRRCASNTTHYIQICFYKLTCIFMEYSIYLITIVGIHLTSFQNESLVLCIMSIVLWILFVPYIFVHVVLQSLQSEEWPPGGFSGIGIYVFMVDVGGVILYMCASWETI